jgi:hypothetical protein
VLSVSESRVKSSFPPLSVSQTIRCSLWKVLQYSTRNSSELTWVYSKKDTGNRWPNSVLRKKCVFKNCFLFLSITWMSMRPLFFSDITYRIVVVYRRFGAGSPLTMEPVGRPETLVNSCKHTLPTSNIPEERRRELCLGGSLTNVACLFHVCHNFATSELWKIELIISAVQSSSYTF